jgi:hypothetical protein
MESKKIIAEMVDEVQEHKGKRDHNEFDEDPLTMGVDEIKTYIKNQDQFCWLFGVEMNYFLPPKPLITWPFIIMVLNGQKKLIKNQFIKIGHNVPRIKELKMETVWGDFKNDMALMEYMPVMTKTTYPPRNYFFKVLATVYPEKFAELLQNAQKKRQRKLIQQNRVIRIDPSLFAEIKRSRNFTNLSSSKKSKRVCFKPKKIKRR